MSDKYHFYYKKEKSKIIDDYQNLVNLHCDYQIIEYKNKLEKISVEFDFVRSEVLLRGIDCLAKALELHIENKLIHRESKTFEIEFNQIVSLFYQGLFNILRDLHAKIDRLKKIILTFSIVKCQDLNADERENIQKMKNNFRHFDEEEKIELSVYRQSRHFNSNNLIQCKTNLRKKLNQLFLIPKLAVK